MEGIDCASLFRPMQLRRVTLRNRIVVPPMVTNRDIVGLDGIQWYSRLAGGGAGLVIVEATEAAKFESMLTVDRLRRLADAIHAEGAAAAVQLFPTNPRSSARPADVSLEEINLIRNRCVLAARRCKEAGFDGVEPHGAHGFLLNQFFSPIRNLRRGNYGGNLDNRMRLGKEIVSAIRDEIGNDFLILYRHTPREDGGYTIDDSIAFAKALVTAGVDVMDISPASDKEPADMAAQIRRAVGCPVIAVNNMDDPARAVEALERERADLIAIGRGLIADPQWPAKVMEGRPGEIVKCRACGQKCHGNIPKGLPIACVQWETPGSESTA